MKLVVAYIQPDKFEDVKEELKKSDVHRMSVSKVNGVGQQKGVVERFRGVEGEVHLLPKIKLEIAVNDSFVDKAVDAIIRGARTGDIGDGKIFILPLEECIRIRTGERGMAAIGGDSAEVKREQDLAFSKSLSKKNNGEDRRS